MFSSLLALIPPSYIYPSLLWLSPARPAWVVSVRSASSLTHVHVSSWTFVVDFLSWTFCRGPFVVDLLSWVCALGGLGVCVGWPYVGWPGCVRWVARAPCPVFLITVVASRWACFGFAVVCVPRCSWPPSCRSSLGCSCVGLVSRPDPLSCFSYEHPRFPYM